MNTEGGLSPNEGDNIRVYFEDKLDEGIRSLKGYLYTFIAVLLTVLGVLVAVAIFASAGGFGNVNAILGLGIIGIIAIIAVSVLVIAHLVFGIMGTLRFNNLLSILNSHRTPGEITKSNSQLLELTNITKNTRNCLLGSLALVLLSVVISPFATLGLFGFVISIVFFVLV